MASGFGGPKHSNSNKDVQIPDCLFHLPIDDASASLTLAAIHIVISGIKRNLHWLRLLGGVLVQPFVFGAEVEKAIEPMVLPLSGQSAFFPRCAELAQSHGGKPHSTMRSFVTYCTHPSPIRVAVPSE